MLVRWTPFSELDRLTHAMNRLFEAPEASAGRATQVAWSPAIDVIEDQDKIVLVADVPGLVEKDLDVQVERDVLTLRGERALDRKNDGEHHRRYERVTGSFARSFTLPPTVDVEHIGAQLKDGVLTLTLPKKPEAQPKKIGISISH